VITAATLIVARVVEAMWTTIVKTTTLVVNVMMIMVNSKSMEFVQMIVVSWRVSIELKVYSLTSDIDIGSCCKQGGCSVSLETHCPSQSYLPHNFQCDGECGACFGQRCKENVAGPRCQQPNEFVENGTCDQTGKVLLFVLMNIY
jgi:hypothetical protein